MLYLVNENMHNRDNTAFENHTVLQGTLGWWNLSFDYLLWHIPTYSALGIVFFFLSQGKEKPYLIWFCTDSTHIFYFSFLIIFFVRNERKIIVGLPNMKTIITVELSGYMSNCKSLDLLWKYCPTRISIWPFQKKA